MNKVEFYKLISKTCCKDVDDKTNLFDLGLSSLTIIKLVNEINTRYFYLIRDRRHNKY